VFRVAVTGNRRDTQRIPARHLPRVVVRVRANHVQPVGRLWMVWRKAEQVHEALEVQGLHIPFPPVPTLGKLDKERVVVTFELIEVPIAIFNRALPGCDWSSDVCSSDLPGTGARR
jgi:hypothetical protein